jgi:cytosine/adenosine deaminase-related metal-dependent hydrolase
MRRIAAQYLFTGKGALIPRGVVALDEDCRVVEIGQLGDTEIAGTEFYNGILLPGFVNAHCHLELSHVKGATTPQAGMAAFLHKMMQRNVTVTPIQNDIHEADAQMYRNGIVAVGDICNTAHSFDTKRKSSIYYHSFIEVAGLPERITEQRKTAASELLYAAAQAHLPATLTPHAPYSMNEALFAYTVEAANRSGILSIHNQESDEENELFINGSGALKTLFASMGFAVPQPTAVTSVHRLLPWLHKNTQLLLVHNTVTTAADYEAVSAASCNVSWVLCPNSNRYITGKIPPADMFFRKNAAVAIGTDSLASNTQLSVLEELKTLAKYFPQIPLTALLQWATSGGAQALRMAHEFGTVEIGKRLRLVLLENLDLQNCCITDDTTVKPLTSSNYVF